MRIGKNGAQGEATAVILAGGASRRMGQDKARLPWRGGPLLGHVIATVRAEFPRVVLSARDAGLYADFGVPTIPDRFPGRGPLCGIASALDAVETPWVFVTACDMPFADATLWRALAAEASDDVDVVVPRIVAGLELLCAFYHPRCLPIFRRRLEQGRYALFQAVHAVRMRDLDASPWIGCASNPFLNINTPADLAAARAVAKAAAPVTA